MAGCTVTFDTNGGTTIEPVKRVHNSDIDVEPPQKEGFAFNGWYADKECTAPVTKMPDHNITLYAGWYTEGLAFTQGANGYGVSVGEATGAEILLPLMHNGLPVTEIADNGFKGSAVESIEITPYITVIGQGAFENCLGLTEILIPSHVVAIKSGAFAGCSNLTIYCPIDEEDMPEGWESGWNFDRPVIWSYRFHTVTFVTGGGSQIQPQTLLFNSSINAASERDGYVFNGWYADEEATTPVTKVPDNDITVYAGWYSSGLQFDQTGDSYSVRKGFATGDIIIPYYYNGKPVTTIPLSAFYSFDDIYSVYIPDSVTDIGEEAFANCKNLTTVRLSNNLTQLKDRVFLGCEKLVEITIPSSVTVVGYCAFSYCYALTSIVIPDSVTQLGESAFGQCSALQSVTLSKNLISIGKDAFRECGSLSSIVIHDKVESIGNSAFAMTNISSVFIPISVQTMGQYVFGWSRAYDVYVYCEAESRPSGWSDDWDGATTCHVQWGASRPE